MEQSTILDEQQVADVVSEQPTVEEEVTLPSDNQEELIGGKFKSQDDLLTAYKELESKLGKPQEEVKEETPEVDEEYEAYKQQKQEEEILKDVGGRDTFLKASEWAKDNLDATELENYNKAIDEAGDNQVIIKALASGLITKFNNREQGTPTPIHSGETTKVEGTKGYVTKSDMMKDMADPRYERDESYRKAVEAKVMVTDESSWYASLPRY